MSIHGGLNLADGVENAYHRFEAERLVAKLAALSHRVHGQDHSTTKYTQSYLRLLKRRFVALICESRGGVFFETLQYEGDGEMLVAKGPINEENESNHVTLHITKKDLDRLLLVHLSFVMDLKKNSI